MLRCLGNAGISYVMLTPRMVKIDIVFLTMDIHFPEPIPVCQHLYKEVLLQLGAVKQIVRVII